MRGMKATAAVVGVCVLVAGVDEWHQSTVVSRTGSPVDVGIDAAGAAVALLLLRLRRRRGRPPAPPALGPGETPPGGPGGVASSVSQ